MICFRITGGQIVPEIDMIASETIWDLKLEIQKEIGVEVERQRLWHNTRELRNYQVIEDYEFRDRETVNLTVTPLAEGTKLHVLVKQYGADGYLRMSELEKVSELRRKVEKYWGIPRDIFTLRRLNRELEDEFPLFAYYISDDTEVELCLDIQPR